RGSVRVVTEPAGATVAVGNYAPEESPAVIDDLRPGRYPVVISKDGFDDVAIEVEILESVVADPGVIRLARQAGSVSITSIPSGVPFDLRPAEGRLFAASDETRQGVTPATLPDLDPGDYVLTYLREGWPRQSERFTIENHRATSVEHRYLGAALRVSSEPAGATVFLNGAEVGTTPMALADIPPGELSLTLELPGYETEKLTRLAEAEQLVDVAVRLELFNRLYSPSELDAAPLAIQTVRPQIASTPDRSGRKVVLSFEVSLSGLPENAVVLEAPDEESGRRCLEALQEWRFTPALAGGRPVRTKVNLPFVIP
ncbi:MAG: TonB family protein, partial [Opitutaceae bacterium]